MEVHFAIMLSEAMLGWPSAELQLRPSNPVEGVAKPIQRHFAHLAHHLPTDSDANVRILKQQ